MRIEVAKNKKRITISYHRKNIELHPLWLRERVNNQELLDKKNGQRLYDPSDLNHELKIKKALIKKNNLNVEFTDGIESNYQINDLISEIKVENLDRPNKKIIYPMALFLLLIFGYNNKRRNEETAMRAFYE